MITSKRLKRPLGGAILIIRFFCRGGKPGGKKGTKTQSRSFGSVKVYFSAEFLSLAPEKRTGRKKAV